MSRDEIYNEIKEKFGFVPTFLKSLPDSSLELEWSLFKKYEIDEGAIESKYRHLIGLGIHATTKCKYCTLFHTEMAKLHGATDAEIEEAVHYAKQSVGWSVYLNGMQVDYDNFRDEVRKASDYIREHKIKKAA